jgi:DNA-binding FadR family transcriptional regulator
MHWLFRHVSDLPELIQEHRDLYAAIASGDPDTAAAQSASHIGKYREQFPEDFQKTEPQLHRKKL